jgi:hypothetical protein
MFGEMVADVLSGGAHPLAPSRSALMAVDVSTGLEVLPEAVAAPVLTPRPKPVELAEGQVPSAPPAALEGIGRHEHMFATAADVMRL